MSSLIRPFLKDRPISAAIRVDRDTVRSPQPESRIFSKVARNSAGDLWTMRYAMGLPAVITLHDSRRRVFIVYQPDESAPTVAQCHSDPADPPVPFPQEAPAETPIHLSGIPCFYREHTGVSTSTDIWYSYEYAAFVRTLVKTEGYGTTDWYLDQVQLEEPDAGIFGEDAIVASQAERHRNIWKVASEFFSRSA